MCIGFSLSVNLRGKVDGLWKEKLQVVCSTKCVRPLRLLVVNSPERLNVSSKEDFSPKRASCLFKDSGRVGPQAAHGSHGHVPKTRNSPSLHIPPQLRLRGYCFISTRFP